MDLCPGLRLSILGVHTRVFVCVRVWVTMRVTILAFLAVALVAFVFVEIFFAFAVSFFVFVFVFVGGFFPFCAFTLFPVLGPNFAASCAAASTFLSATSDLGPTIFPGIVKNPWAFECAWRTDGYVSMRVCAHVHVYPPGLGKLVSVRPWARATVSQARAASDSNW